MWVVCVAPGGRQRYAIELPDRVTSSLDSALGYMKEILATYPTLGPNIELRRPSKPLYEMCELTIELGSSSSSCGSFLDDLSSSPKISAQLTSQTPNKSANPEPAISRSPKTLQSRADPAIDALYLGFNSSQKEACDRLIAEFNDRGEVIQLFSALDCNEESTRTTLRSGR